MATSTTGNSPTEELLPFYQQVLHALSSSPFPILIAGTYAVRFHTGIHRPSKDVDFFCKASDYPKILSFVQQQGFAIAIEDERWLARIYEGDTFVDLIWGGFGGTWQVTQDWIDRGQKGEIAGVAVQFLSPIDLLLSKVERLKRKSFDGPDIVNLLVRTGKSLDWESLLTRMEHNWELLLMHLMQFRYVYPSERDVVPRSIMQELLSRVQLQLELPIPNEKVTRGMVLSPGDYCIAIEKWGYKDVTRYTFETD